MIPANPDQLLREHFPLLYRRVDCGMHCMPGWYDAVFRASEKLEALIAAMPTDPCYCEHSQATHGGPDGSCQGVSFDRDEDPAVSLLPCACDGYDDPRPRCVQLKEKFGGVRCYLSSETPEMSQVIRELEEECWRTCANCGTTPASPKGVGWYVLTECDPCHREREASPA